MKLPQIRFYRFTSKFLALFIIASFCNLVWATDISQTLPELDLIVDRLTLGNANSEKGHGFDAQKSEHIIGGLNQPAVKLLRSNTVSWQSAPMEFTMKVDPDNQNYLTLKLWGSDKGADCGRLFLFIDGMQVGYEQESDYGTLNQTEDDPEALGRFIYQTQPLPARLTRGKTSVTMSIIGFGPSWYYGNTFEQFQKPFVNETRGIYAIYTHTSGYFTPPQDEVQGTTAPPPIRPASPGEEVIDESKKIVIERVNQALAKKLDDKPEPNSGSYEQPLLFLAASYNTEWTPAYKSPAAIDAILELGDHEAADFAADPSCASKSWGGAGPLGEAIMKTWPEISRRMDETITCRGESLLRRDAWSRVLHSSVDYWRTHRRSYTNQSMIVDRNIYTANRGLHLISPSLALPEKQVLGYVYQAVGIEPWSGSDPVSGQDQSVIDTPNANVPNPYGAHYYQITKKGLSRELGFVAAYGETILRFTHDMAVLTGDDKIREQFKKMVEARLFFRYPTVDADGYQCMKLPSEIDNRGEHFPIGATAYAENFSSREVWGLGSAAFLSDDAKVVGATQQCLADNQYFPLIASRLRTSDGLGMLRNIEDYQKVKALPLSPSRLPMTEGQPDFVFSDEENAVLAIKHGDTRLFVNLYFRAENAVNRVARIFEITPNMTRIATVRTQVKIDYSGHVFERPDLLHAIRQGEEHLKPPGTDWHQAWAGEVMPIAKRPDDAPQPAYGAWGPFLGKAAFYSVQYGDYLIAVNTTNSETFNLPTPQGIGHAKDLVSGQDLLLDKAGTQVGPLSTVVLYFGK